MVTLVGKLVASPPNHAAVPVGCHSKKLIKSFVRSGWHKMTMGLN